MVFGTNTRLNNSNNAVVCRHLSLTPPLGSFCLFQKWFRLRNAQWRQAEGLPAQLGSVKD